MTITPCFDSQVGTQQVPPHISYHDVGCKTMETFKLASFTFQGADSLIQSDLNQ